MLAFKEEKAAVLDNQASSQVFPTGNLPIVDNNSSTLINMAYVMNQQLQSSQNFENKPEFVHFTGHHSMPNAVLQQAPLNMPIGANNSQFNNNQDISASLNEKSKKEATELVFANNMSVGANNSSNNENNLESSYSHGKIK